MASLLTTGRQIKGSALAGLTSVAQQEASQNIAEEQLKQAKEAQSQQLLGTGLGVAGAYAAPKIASSMAAKKAAAEGAATAAGGGGATALLTNPYTYAAIAAAFLLKKIFD